MGDSGEAYYNTGTLKGKEKTQTWFDIYTKQAHTETA